MNKLYINDDISIKNNNIRSQMRSSRSKLVNSRTIYPTG